MTPKQRARLEEAAKNFGVWLLPYEVKAALVHIDALEARVGKLDGENAQMADSLVRELSREPGPCGHPQCHQYDLTPWGGDKGCVACEKDALAAERDALVKRLAERDVEVANQRTAIHTLGQLVQQAERERDEARALVRHLQSELRAEVDGCKEAERTAAERDAAVTTWEAAARSWELRAEQAEPIAAAISAFVQEEGDISVRWVFAPGVSVFSECGDAHKKWHGLVQQVVFLVDGLLRRQQEAEREREEALADAKSLREELTREAGFTNRYIQRLHQAERTAAALREALCRHGIHDVTCAKRRSLFTLYEAVPCDCGFDAALAPTKAHDFECGLTQGQVPYCTCGLDLSPSAAPVCEHDARTEAPSIRAPSGRVVCRKCHAVLSAAPGEGETR